MISDYKLYWNAYYEKSNYYALSLWVMNVLQVYYVYVSSIPLNNNFYINDNNVIINVVYVWEFYWFL